MVQPAESRKGLNLAFTRRANFCCTTRWRVLPQSKMSPILMVVEHVGRQQSFEMPLIYWALHNIVTQEMQDLAPVVADEEKAVQNTKRERWDGEKVHCGNGLAMVSEERQPLA